MCVFCRNVKNCLNIRKQSGIMSVKIMLGSDTAMVKLKNEFIKVEIDEKGAEMRKVTVNGEERLWNGDPAFWTGTAPVLFPICGGLPDDKFTFKGKEYTLNKHGFAKVSVFEVEKITDTSAVFLLRSSKETLEKYPWDFELRITYTLRDTAIKIVYDVTNKSGETMYMSIGSHEAYACPEGIEDYDVIFEKKETLNAYDLDGNLTASTVTPIIMDTDTLPLYYKYFAIDALVFKNLKSRFATLRNRKTGKSVSVSFPDCDYFLLWTKPNAGYICLEPWTGIQPAVGSGYDITEKEGISSVKAGDTKTVTHTLYF